MWVRRFQPVYCRPKVILFSDPAVVTASAASDSTEVEAERYESGVVESLRGSVNRFCMHGATV
tara:strand:+ start:77 stop:265 length:189 start_codon:yes stop_codon:yes gene_type:complete